MLRDVQGVPESMLPGPADQWVRVELQLRRDYAVEWWRMARRDWDRAMTAAAGVVLSMTEEVVQLGECSGWERLPRVNRRRGCWRFTR